MCHMHFKLMHKTAHNSLGVPSLLISSVETKVHRFLLHKLLIIVIIVIPNILPKFLPPQRSRLHFLVHEQFLKELIANREGQVAVDEVHEPHPWPSVVERVGARGEQSLHDGVDDRAEVRIGLFGVGLEQLLGLGEVVFAVFFQQRRR